jgi:hypothetical protein
VLCANPCDLRGKKENRNERKEDAMFAKKQAAKMEFLFS